MLSGIFGSLVEHSHINWENQGPLVEYGLKGSSRTVSLEIKRKPQGMERGLSG